jgi:hypothetical protein
MSGAKRNTKKPVRVSVEIPPGELKKLGDLAVADRRTRKNYMEIVLVDHANNNNPVMDRNKQQNK